IEVDLEPLTETGKRRIEVKARIGQCRPTRQRPPVLDFLLAPPPRGFLEFGVVREDPAEVMRIGRAVVLDKARRLDDPHEFRIDPAPVEVVPRNIVERPRAHPALSYRPSPLQCGLLIHQSDGSIPLRGAPRGVYLSARSRPMPAIWRG